jgi:1-acyl-sn-glycerol-3-phosphate acyltransferase
MYKINKRKRYFMRIILVVLFFVLYLLFGFPVLGIEWLLAKRNQEAADLRRLHMVQWALRCITVLAGIKLTVKGKENIPTDQPVLYIANHRSLFDIVVTYPLFPGLTGFISKDVLKKVPGLGLWMQRCHCLFLDRTDLKRGLKTILDAIDKVKSGISIVIFPEGTRNRQADQPASLLPFRDGALKIAQKSGCPIVPMVLTGTDDVLENHIPWIRPTEVTVTFGKPIVIKDLAKEDQKRLGAYCQGVVQEMLEAEVASR